MAMKDWVTYNLPDIWKDFAGDENGIMMTIWDASRLRWFSRPDDCPDSRLKKFLTNPPFKRFGYFPMDATGPNDRLTAVLGDTIKGYDRVLAYSKWAEDILRRTLDPLECEDLDLTNLPHGIDTSVFHPRHRTLARHGFGERLGIRNNKGRVFSVPDDSYMIGIVATNQIRKDFGLGIATVAELVHKKRNVLLWIHTDELERHWSIVALLNDFNLVGRSLVTTVPLTDEQMAFAYSACDLTLGIGAGEGYGFCLFESLACGTPCIHGNYGGAAEHMPAHMLVEPDMYRLEGIYSCVRPVFTAQAWAEKIEALPKERATLPAHLDWNFLWRQWADWLRKGTLEASPVEAVGKASS